MASTPAPIVTRFAPSPTGHLHIGGARTALFCWAFAKKQGGRFMIRIEDTDQARSSDESARGILDDLAWLGIDWDDGPLLKLPGDGGTQRVIGGDARGVGPFFQAQRVETYNAYIEHLVKLGHAYPAFETNEELDAARKAAAAVKATFKYQRPADVVLGHFNEARWKRALAGERHVIRFAMPPTDVVVNDEVLGEVRFAAGEVDDFVIRKADGFPTYHFAVVIDDELMGVTHVLRAQEHLMNTPRHVAMQQALTRLERDGGGRFRTPFYGHMPLIFNLDGGKMSKRDKAKVARKAVKEAMAKDKALTAATVAERAGLDAALVAQFIAADNDNLEVAEKLAKAFGVVLPEIEVWDFRLNGYLPEAITNFLSLLGWSPGKGPDGKDLEKFDNKFLAANFDLSRIGKTNARFDRVKLMSFNADVIAAMSDAEFRRRWGAWCAEYEPDLLKPFSPHQIDLLVQAIRPRCKVFRDSVALCRMFATPDNAVAFDPKSVDKHLKAAAEGQARGADVVAAFVEQLAKLPAFDPKAIDALVDELAKSRGVGIGQVAQPIRVAVTGGTVSPPLGLTLAILGRDSVAKRISRCLAAAG